MRNQSVKWYTRYSDSELNWESIYSIPFQITRDTYTQWFQARIIHRILGTNSLLFKMNITNTKMCTFCGSVEETLIHIFLELSKSKNPINIHQCNLMRIQIISKVHVLY